MRVIAIAAAMGMLFFLAFGPANAACTQSARVLIDCWIDGTVLNVEVDAKTKGCGRPEFIPNASLLFILADKRVGNWTGLASEKLEGVELPASAQFELCPGDPDATAIRGRAFLSQLDPAGVFENRCSPLKPLTCP